MESAAPFAPVALRSLLSVYHSILRNPLNANVYCGPSVNPLRHLLWMRCLQPSFQSFLHYYVSAWILLLLLPARSSIIKVFIAHLVLQRIFRRVLGCGGWSCNESRRVSTSVHRLWFHFLFSPYSKGNIFRTNRLVYPPKAGSFVHFFSKQNTHGHIALGVCRVAELCRTFMKPCLAVTL